jgi:hypothetical protein
LSILSEYQIRFQNVESVSERVIWVKDPVMLRFAKSCYRLLDQLDREIAQDVRISIFVFIRKICALVTPRFDDELVRVEIRKSFNDLESKLRGHIQDTGFIDMLNTCLDQLIERGNNPKFDCITELISQSSSDSNPGIVWRGSKWLTFNLSPCKSIKSIGRLISFEYCSLGIYGSVYTPMPLTKLKKQLANHFVLDGFSSEINCVLYSFESNPTMLISEFIAADDGSVRNLVELSSLPEIEYVIDDLQIQGEEFVEPDTSFGSDQELEDVVQILMESGYMATLDKNNQVWVVRGDEDNLTFEEEWPDLLDEGDRLIFVREHYVDTTDTLLEVDWRLALSVLLTLQSVSDVCDEIASMSVPRPSETTLRNWASGDVYGPADREVFNSLIDVLVENKVLSPEATERSRNQWWQHLNATRTDQRNQGLAARRRLIEDIRASLTEALDGIQSLHGVHIEIILATQLSGVYGRGEVGYLSGTDLRVMQ